MGLTAVDTGTSLSPRSVGFSAFPDRPWSDALSWARGWLTLTASFSTSLSRAGSIVLDVGELVAVASLEWAIPSGLKVISDLSVEYLLVL